MVLMARRMKDDDNIEEMRAAFRGMRNEHYVISCLCLHHVLFTCDVTVFDRDGSGSIDANELKYVLVNLSDDLTDGEIMAMIEEADEDGNGEIDFDGKYKTDAPPDILRYFELVYILPVCRIRANDVTRLRDVLEYPIL